MISFCSLVTIGVLSDGWQTNWFNFTESKSKSLRFSKDYNLRSYCMKPSVKDIQLPAMKWTERVTSFLFPKPPNFVRDMLKYVHPSIRLVPPLPSYPL